MWAMVVGRGNKGIREEGKGRKERGRRRRRRRRSHFGKDD